MKKGWIVVLASIAALPVPAAAETFFCAAEMATGFKFQDGLWRSTDFYIDSAKFTVSSTADKPLTYAVKKLGHQHPTWTCERGAYEGSVQIEIVCGGLGMGLVVNTKTLRFIEFYGHGYTDGDKPGNSPAVTLGKCTKID